MGYATKDLMLFEEIEDDVMRICDSFNYPYRLLSSNKSNSLAGSDISAYMKLLYQDAIIPEAESDYEQWEQFFGTDKLGLKITKDYDHVQALQADKTNEATARKTLNDALKIEWEADIITLNQWLVKLGENPIGSDGDKRRSQMPRENGLLAVSIGVGGVQGLIAILSDSIMSDSAKQAALEILFGLQPTDAARMVVSNTSQSNSNSIGNGNT
jgi:hypothetical protein